ncbi:hypothetical protein C8Q76DRAFT_707874 [Earliella scabrosa]|nr:hypothetical protein C8Q76DRAFT_707874 [Earliella scabrosa]
MPRMGCIGTSSLNSRAGVISLIVSRSFFIISDLLVIYVTWSRLYRLGRIRHIMSRKHSLAYVVLRDGMYSSREPKLCCTIFRFFRVRIALCKWALGHQIRNQL